MSYNIFSNIISNVSENNNVRAVVREVIETIQNTIDTTLSKFPMLIVENYGGYDGMYRQLLSKKSLNNNTFSGSSYYCYVLYTNDVFYLIIFVVASGWCFVEFNINPELIIDLPIDISTYINSMFLISSETRYFGSSSFPKTLNISYN